MPKFLPDLSLPAKVITVCATGMLLGIGTCGLGAVFGMHRFASYFFVGGSILFYPSLAILLIALLVLVIKAIVEFFKR